MLPLIILLPLLIALLLIALVRNSGYAGRIALLGSIASLLLLRFVGYGVYSVGWLGFGGYLFGITVMVAPINLLLLFIVLLIAPIIFLYSMGFMNIRSEQKRFYIEMLAFEMSMLAFAMSGSFITLFISWEFLSVTSYLLIGFWNGRERATRAARKAITIVIIGDLALLASIVIIWSAFGSLEFLTIFSGSNAGTPALYAAAILLAIAILTKSAQFPFQEWLPDAMEGPTPVSAFLHSTTMVKAGVFAAVILLPIFAETHTTSLLSVSSLITVVLATMNALKETHIKRVIAYSTVQELGLMLLAISNGAVLAAMYFFFAQSFYKALLFFGAGAAMNATGTEDLGETSGMWNNRLIYVSTAFGVLSLAGFVPFAGFFADLGIGSSLLGNTAIYAVISFIGLLTSFYIFRWFFLNTKVQRNYKIGINYQTQPRSMTYSMALLAALTLAASAFFFFMPKFLGGGTRYYLTSLLNGTLRIDAVDASVVMTVAVIGAALSYLVYKKGESINRYRALGSVIYNSAMVNEAYIVFSKLVYEVAEGAALFDLYLNDFFDDFGKAFLRSGYAIRRASVGDINAYALLLSAVLLIMLAYAYLAGLM